MKPLRFANPKESVLVLLPRWAAKSCRAGIPETHDESALLQPSRTRLIHGLQAAAPFERSDTEIAPATSENGSQSRSG